jgi:hypothetical protein
MATLDSSGGSNLYWYRMTTRKLVKTRIYRLVTVIFLTVVSLVVHAKETANPRKLRLQDLSRGPGARRLERPLISRQTRYRIKRGLKWLARKQQRRGLWLGKKPAYRVGISALAGLAFLSSGDVGKRGKYSENVERVSRYLAENQRYGPDHAAGLFFDKQAALLRSRPLHGHGLALLYLAQSYGELQNPALRARLRKSILKGISLTEGCQSQGGGWNYMPGDKKDEGSVTVTQIQALRAARNAGFIVNKEVIDDAVEYVAKSQDHRGGIRYRINASKVSPALTAAGLTVFHGAGIYGAKPAKRALHFLNHYLIIEKTLKDHFFFYGHFYAGQAYFQQGEESFRTYYERIREELIQLQRGDGSWENKIFGDEYATAMALLILQVPNSYLPIYQR